MVAVLRRRGQLDDERKKVRAVRGRICDHVPNGDAEPFAVLGRYLRDGLEAVSDVVLEVVLVIVDGDLRIVEERSERGAAE